MLLLAVFIKKLSFISNYLKKWRMNLDYTDVDRSSVDAVDASIGVGFLVVYVVQLSVLTRARWKNSAKR